jgi:hypothetical protein
LEIRRRNDFVYDGTFSTYEACGEECRALAANPAITWIRVVTEQSPFAFPAPPARSFFRIGRGWECGGKLSACVLSASDSGEAADMVIQFLGPDEKSWKPYQTALVSELRWKRVIAFQKRDDRFQAIYLRTQVNVEIPVRPAVFGPEIHHNFTSEGAAPIRTAKTIGKLSLGRTLLDLGLVNETAFAAAKPTTSSADKTIAPELTSEAAAVLDLPQSGRFDAEQWGILMKWLKRAANEDDWPPARIALLRRMLRDPRVNGAGMGDVFERHPEVARALLSDVFELLREKGVVENSSPVWVAMRLPNMDVAALAPHASEALALYQRGGDLRDLILPAIGRFGFDPRPYLLPFEADRDDGAPFPRHIRGACTADRIWAPVLLDALRDAALRAPRDWPSPVNEAEPYANLYGEPRKHHQYYDALLNAIAILGDEEFVTQHPADPREPRKQWLPAKSSGLKSRLSRNCF